MTKWYINDLELSEDTLVTSRQNTSQWHAKIGEIRKHKAVVNTIKRKPRQIVLNIQLRGDDRFLKESSIRAELEKSPSIWLESNNDHLYENIKYSWFVPTGFNVNDDGHKYPLKCILTGTLDERTINNCQFTTGWTNTDSSIVAETYKAFSEHPWINNPTYRVNSKVGTNQISAYNATANSTTVYIFPYTRNLSNADAVYCWIYLFNNISSYSAYNIGLCDGSSTAYADVRSDMTTAGWYYIEKPVSYFTNIDLETITKFTIQTTYTTTNSALAVALIGVI